MDKTQDLFSNNSNSAKLTNYQSNNPDENLYLEKYNTTYKNLYCQNPTPTKNNFHQKIFNSEFLEGENFNIPAKEVDILLKTTRMHFNKTDPKKNLNKFGNNSLSQNIETHYLEDNQMARSFGSEDMMKDYLKSPTKNGSIITIKKSNDNSNLNRSNNNKFDFCNENSKYNRLNKDSSNDLPSVKREKDNYVSKFNYYIKSTEKGTLYSLSEIKNKSRYKTKTYYKIQKKQIPASFVVNTKKNEEAVYTKSYKTIYDFKSNYKKLIHHWNESNPHVVFNDNGTDENNIKIERKFYKPKKQSVESYMTAQEIFNLFSIENKNELFKSKINYLIYLGQINENSNSKYAIKKN